MKKYFKAKILISIILLMSASFFIIHIVQAVTADPGSDQDPVITQSYVDAKVNELNTKINELTAKLITASASNVELNNQIVQLKNQNKFTVIQVPMAKQLICGASTELVLRSGEAITIASENGGISNLISGKDLGISDGILKPEIVPKNQLMLIPRDDGRGIRTITECFILIKGEYNIK